MVGAFPGSHELRKSHQILAWSRLAVFQLGHPAPPSAADLLSQVVLGDGPVLGIAGLL